MKRVKIPKQGRKHYHKGYNIGYRRGQLKAAEGTAAQATKKEYEEVKKASDVLPPVDTHAIKWQGFTEAMKLIIESRR